MNFVSDRTHKVWANNELSHEAKVISGVPQGTVIKPLLLLIMIDDISEINMEAIINAFADDSKVGLKIDNIND